MSGVGRGEAIVRHPEFEEPEMFRINPNRNCVVSRKVTRYFLWGKGYARKIDAYRAKARHELYCKVSRMAHDRMPKIRLPWSSQLQIIRDLEKQVLAEMFPPRCDRPNESNLPNLRHGGEHPFCRGCRWHYLNVRAKELEEQNRT